MSSRRSTLVNLALLALLTACTSSEQPRACTGMGGYDGVQFEASAIPAIGPLPRQATFCAGLACQDRTVETYQDSSFFAYNDQLSEIPVTARLSVLDAAGAVLLDASTTLTPVLIDINGGGCGPLVWQARAVAAADGTLLAAPVEH